MSTPAYRLVRAARPQAAPPVLDDAQQRVLDHPGGPLLVLAGPGTGKTTTLVETVAARVSAGVPVENVLMLTFSRRAAGELRDRVAARLGHTTREPVARTLHSYAFGVLRMAAVYRGDPPPRLLAAAEQDVVIRELLDGGDPERWPAALRPALRTLGFASELRDLLMRAVERGLDARSLADLGRRKGRADWVAAAAFLDEYQGVTVLHDPGGYDPAELIQGAIAALHEQPALLAAERERRRRLFVDEYQDTDPAQAELLALLADGADELVLVGDPDQSIYAFRGADDNAIREVDARFGRGGEVPVVALTQCRRSGGTLVEATRRIAHRLPGRGEQRTLVPAPGDPGRVTAAVFRSASEEAAYLAGVLRSAHLAGTPWSRMAVLVRSTSRTLGTLRRAMTTAGVPVAVRGDDLPLAEQGAVTTLLTAVSCAAAPDALGDDVAEGLLTGPLGGGDAMYLRRLRRELRRQFPDDAGSVVPALRDPIGASLLPDAVRRPVERVARVLAAATAALDGGSIEDVLWAVWHASGLARRWETASAAGGAVGAAADRDLDAVVELFRAAAAFTDRLPDAAPAQFVEHLRAQQLPGGALSGPEPEPDAVAVLTAHASKGLEWDVVCVAAVQEGTWPDLRRRGSLLGSESLVETLNGLDDGPLAPLAPQLAEERRLFYVAVTRARRDLVVTAVAGDEEQPSRLLDELDPLDDARPLQPPLRGVHLPGLVAELRAVACDDDTAPDERLAAATELARLSEAGVAGADPDEWWGLAPLSTEAGATDPARPVRISPSRVESFLTCELRTLLVGFGAGEAQGTAAGLGSLIHGLAEYAPHGLTLDEFERLLDERWSELDFGAPWFAANERRRARTMLTRLVEWLNDSRGTLTFVAAEADFEVAVGDAVLAGRVDRLERDPDGRLVVVDFKTGRTKARDLETNPQLGTYQLAIAEGAFAAEGREPGGGQLVQLGAGGATAQVQGPLADADDPQWVRRTVEGVAARLRGFEFTARENSYCFTCDVSSSCPVQPQGRQVTQ
ncbi:ATP-dependent DNA helicase [Jatrophihabitans endophyticus]|uniref:ATP-dependent helicase n=1 Tax=Jatrophihabitans endophyticus TaxID=1206085 RepID=UPI0026ED723A|nr:ATP-dependent DNA helicase [Jatrophihabitans endophyticus]